MVIQTLGRSRPNKLNQALSGVMGGAQSFSEAMGVQKQEQQRLEENQAIKRETGQDLSGIRDERTREMLLSDKLTSGRKMNQANAGSGINPFSPNSPKNNTTNPTKKNTVNNPTASQEKLPVLSPEEVWAKGQQTAQQYRDNNVPMTDEQGFELQNSLNTENINHNNRVEAQTEAYGNLGQEAIGQVMPDASPELTAIFRGYGEEEKNKLSPAEARKSLAKKAAQFKNKVSAIENSIGPRRLFSGIVQDISGTGREEEKVNRAMREKLKFLHDQGLFDTERKLLSGLGYYPEEVESLVSNLPENTQKTIAQLPEFKKEYTEKPKLSAARAGKLPKLIHKPEDLEKIKGSIENILTSDPNTNLILLRKELEKKNVDWETYKDILDDMVINGKIKLNPDQDLAFTDTLDQPPLTTLGKILKKFNLGGS